MKIHLVNGQHTVRQRNSEGCTVLDCGCAYDPVQWLQICGTHWAAWQRLHEEAAHAHARERKAVQS